MKKAFTLPTCKTCVRIFEELQPVAHGCEVIDIKSEGIAAEDLERISKKSESIDFATLGIASASDKDVLQTIKGIGPFIEEKLYALGIFTFEQVGNMTPEIETQVNLAIEFFPGRVKRDQWAKQARKLHNDN